MARRQRHDRVETALQPGPVLLQRGVFQARAASSDLAGAPKKMAQRGRENPVPGINGIWGVAQEMGEADLVFPPRQPHLAAVAVGPSTGSGARNLGGNHPKMSPERFCPAGIGDKHRAVAVMEHP